MKNDDAEHFFEELYFRYAIKLERMCYKYVSYQNEYTSIIEESIQETFLQAIKQYQKLQIYTPSHLEAWLVETCWNRLKPAVNKYRRRKKRYISIDNEEQLHLPVERIQNDVNEVLECIHRKETLEKLLNALNQRERDIVERHIVRGQPLPEIARQEQISIGAAKSILARARAKARRIREECPHDFFVIFVSFLHVVYFMK